MSKEAALLNNLLQHTDIAMVFFNENTDLEFVNYKVGEMWKVNMDALEVGISIVDFFQILREKQVYPEPDDFDIFCQDIKSYFRNLQSKVINNLTLNLGQNIEQSIIPFQGGLLILWENTSRLWELTYSLNIYKNIYQRIVERTSIPIIIVGSNGLIEMSNLEFARFFSLDRDIFDNKETHISNLLNMISNTEGKSINYLVQLFLSRKEFSYNFSSKHQKHIDVSGFPLPNGSNFIMFTTMHKLIYKEQNESSKTSDHLISLQNNHVLELDKLLATPLNIIIGFADIIQSSYLGNLNNKQNIYINKILQTAQQIKSNLANKIYLTLYANPDNSSHKEKIDLNELVVSVVEQAKLALKEANIKLDLNLNFKDNVNIFYNFKLIEKAIALILCYMIEQNDHNSLMTLTVNDNPLEFIIQDSSKMTLFTKQDLNTRYDILIIIETLKLLNGSYKILKSNRKFRTLIINFPGELL